MSRKFLFSLATILIVIGIIGGIFTVNASKETVTKKLTFPSADINDLEVFASNVKLKVLPNIGEEILVELNGTKAKSLEQNLDAKIDGQTLKVNFKDSKWTFFGFDSFLNSLELTIQLPEKQYEELNVKSDNGRITVNDIQAKRIDLDTANGIIEGTNLITSTFKASTNNGIITMKDIEGDIQGESDNGKISLTTPDLEQSIHLETDNGKITIRSEAEPENVTFITNVGNGSVDIFGKYDGSAVIGDGDHVVELKTGNGKINISH